MFSFLKKLFSKEAVSDTIYVGNLVYSANSNDLRSLFSDFGKIKNARIIRDSNTRRSKGFGFVTFSSNNEAQKALKLEGERVKGRPIRVRIAKSKPREDG